MKTLILTLVLFFLLLTNISAQWGIINDGSALTNCFLNTIDFINENTGWLAGSNGTLLKTSDGGENWNSISINESWNINQIDFINESVGWAIGGAYQDPNCYIWKTSDGGIIWQQQFSNVWFGSLYVLDKNNVYAVGGDAIFKTTNGGTNWIDVSNLKGRNYNSLWFQDSKTGVVVGNYNDGTADRGIILRTTDGGNNWNETIVNEFSSIFDLQFLDNTNGYFRANTDTTHSICKTEDMFSSWTEIIESPYSIGEYQFLNRDTVYAIMGTNINSDIIMKSIDGGISWQYNTYFDNPYLQIYNIYFSSTNNGFILGNGAVLLRSIDGGLNWGIIKISYHHINNVYFLNSNKGFFIGGGLLPNPWGYRGRAYGDLFSTIDGGITWEYKYHFNNIGEKCFFTNDAIGYTVASCLRDISTEINKTTDSGNSWNQIYNNNRENSDSLGYCFSANDIYFVYEQDGFAVGIYSDSISQGGGILYTSDGGENWDLYWKFPNNSEYEYNLKSIHFIETTGCGWTVGDGGMIAKFTTCVWVKQTAVTDLPLNKVFFSDDNHGWIVGGYQSENDFHPILLKTTNGGVNWTTVPNIPYLFRDIAFVDNNLGWAIGYNSSGVGGILETIDGGITWSIDTGNLPAQLNALHIKDGYGWAVGENGLILRTKDAGAVWVEEEDDNTFPTEFVLSQNYPNPFNPSTTIKYSIPELSKVQLKLFNLLGEEVTTLVNEEKNAGNYFVEFNASSLPSGVYFYQLKAGEFMSVKKMILLK